MPIATSAVQPPRRLSFSLEDWTILSRHWYPVAIAETLGEQPMAVTLLDYPLVLWRADGLVHAARDLCSHRGVPLSRGWVEDGLIVCPYHGLRYAADGRCRKIPAHPEIVPSPRFQLPVFPVVERYGLIWTSLAGTDPAGIPPFEAWDLPGYRQILPPSVDIHGSAGRQVEGFVDVAHFAWVHHEAFASRDQPVVPDYTAALTDYGVHAEYRSTVPNYPKGVPDTAPEGFVWLREFDVYPPFTARLIVHFPDKDRLWILNAACPVSARETRLFVPIAQNFNHEVPAEAIHAFNAQIFAEDQAMIEIQKPEDLPLDLSEEAHFPADRSSTAYRRALARMGLGFNYTR